MFFRKRSEIMKYTVCILQELTLFHYVSYFNNGLLSEIA